MFSIQCGVHRIGMPHPRRFLAKFKYDGTILEHIRTIPGRFFDKNEKTWSFPDTELHGLVTFLAQNKINFELINSPEPGAPGIKFFWANDMFYAELASSTHFYHDLRKASFEAMSGNYTIEQHGENDILVFNSSGDVQNVLEEMVRAREPEPEVKPETDYKYEIKVPVIQQKQTKSKNAKK